LNFTLTLILAFPIVTVLAIIMPSHGQIADYRYGKKQPNSKCPAESLVV
jgi:hypothetical protein